MKPSNTKLLTFIVRTSAGFLPTNLVEFAPCSAAGIEMGFTFKQFHVDDDRCGMKVSTDSVLLGCWARLPQQGRILDAGSGSGLLALMCAQRSEAHIDAVELDPAACDQATSNVRRSPWSDQIEVIRQELGAFARTQTHGYHHVISNPPYFEAGVVAPCPQRARARHGLPFNQLLDALVTRLHPQGRISLVIPATALASLQQARAEHALHLSRLTAVKTVARKPDKLYLLELARQAVTCEQTQLVIHHHQGVYSDEFKHLTANFYLNG